MLSLLQTRSKLFALPLPVPAQLGIAPQPSSCKVACVRQYGSRDKPYLLLLNARYARPGEDWKPLLCSAMADGLLPGAGKKLARQALRALCGGHSAYRDAKVSFRLRLLLQVRIV